MFNSSDTASIIGTFIIILIVLIIIFLICRELICWYYKINRIVELMEEQNGLLKRMLGVSNPQEDSETIAQMDYNVQKESVDVEKLIPFGWAEGVTKDEKIKAMLLVSVLGRKEVIVKDLSKNWMIVRSLKSWNNEQGNSDFKLIYKKPI